jgi:hypothetical protein
MPKTTGQKSNFLQIEVRDHVDSRVRSLCYSFANVRSGPMLQNYMKRGMVDLEQLRRRFYSSIDV